LVAVRGVLDEVGLGDLEALLLPAAGLAHGPLRRVEIVLIPGHAADGGGLRGGRLGLLGGAAVVVLLPGIALHTGPLPAAAARESRAGAAAAGGRGRAGRSVYARPARGRPTGGAGGGGPARGAPHHRA